MSDGGDGLKNQRIAEYLFLALIIGIGTPACLIWGASEGNRMAAAAYPREKTAAPTHVATLDMYLPTSANVEKGRALFQANCVSCHGQNADGQGPAAVALTPPPRSFTDPKARWTRGRNPRDIFRVLSEGSPGTAMVSFGASLPESQRWALVHYLGTLPGVSGQFAPIDEALALKLSEEKR